MNREKRRLMVILNFFFLLLLWVGFYLSRLLGYPIPLLILAGSGLILLIISFLQLYIKTGLWSLVHSSFSKLDERQIQSIYKALRFSYSIFTILILIVIYSNFVLGIAFIDAVLGIILIYLAHILPAAILAWTEKEL